MESLYWPASEWSTLQVTNEEGKPVIDDSFLILVNASHEGVEFTLPPPLVGSNWNQVIDTENIDEPFAKVVVDAKVIVGGRSLKLLSDETPQS